MVRVGQTVEKRIELTCHVSREGLREPTSLWCEEHMHGATIVRDHDSLDSASAFGAGNEACEAGFLEVQHFGQYPHAEFSTFEQTEQSRLDDRKTVAVGDASQKEVNDERQLHETVFDSQVRCCVTDVTLGGSLARHGGDSTRILVGPRQRGSMPNIYLVVMTCGM
jgi:hypothetical protein